MHIFFDTEFTQFREGELLSIGFVADNDLELVVEICDSSRHQRASEFCRTTVIPQFGATPGFRSHCPLIDPDLRVSRIRLSTENLRG